MMLKTSLAKAQHSMWNIKFGSYLRHAQLGEPEDIILDSKKCYLGAWLADKLMRSRSRPPILMELIRVHQRLHEQAQLIIQLKQEGKLSEAMNQLTKLSEISDQILVLLDRIESETALTDCLI